MSSLINHTLMPNLFNVKLINSSIACLHFNEINMCSWFINNCYFIKSSSPWIVVFIFLNLKEAMNCTINYLNKGRYFNKGIKYIPHTILECLSAAYSMLMYKRNKRVISVSRACLSGNQPFLYLCSSTIENKALICIALFVTIVFMLRFLTLFFSFLEF